VASTKNAGVINELSNVCSQLFDLQYKSLTTLAKNKFPVSEANIKQLNFFGAKFLKYTQQMLRDFFPTSLKLVQDALDSGTVTDPASGQQVLECLTENHIFHLYVNLMFRTAQKSELMVLERHREKLQYMQLSLSYYSELVKLLSTMQSMMRQSPNARPAPVQALLTAFIESRSSQFKERIVSVQSRLKDLAKQAETNALVEQQQKKSGAAKILIEERSI